MKIDKEFYQKLIRLVLPIAFQNFMLAVVSASDAIMLGFLNQNALSAVSLAAQIQFIHSLFLMAFVIGLTTLIAQYWGKKDIGSMEKIFVYVLKVSGLVSLLFSLSAFLYPRLLMHIFTSDPVLIQMGADYLKVVAISYFISGISQIYLCMLKNTEHATDSTLISAATVVINIILNALLIFGLFIFPSLEIKGAAIATVIARSIELIWSVFCIQKKKQIHFKIDYFKYSDWILKKDFWHYTLPVLGNEIAWGGGFTMFSVIMGHLGSDAVAANAIANIVKNLVVCISLGIGSGGSIIVGNELGKGNLQRAKIYGKKLVKLSLICGVASGLFLLLIRPLLLQVSTLNTQATELFSYMLFICAYYLVGKSVNATVVGGIFCAGGDTRFGLICDTITMWIIVIPLGAFAAFYLKVPVMIVYFLLNIDEIIKLPAVYIHYKKYKWVKDLTRTGQKMEGCQQ